MRGPDALAASNHDLSWPENVEVTDLIAELGKDGRRKTKFGGLMTMDDRRRLVCPAPSVQQWRAKLFVALATVF